MKDAQNGGIKMNGKKSNNSDADRFFENLFVVDFNSHSEEHRYK